MAEIVLQARDIAMLVGLTEDAVKQWTIGRPYSIRPSIRSSLGKGIPNLYSQEDALRFYVAIELTADGFQSHVIQQALVSFNPDAKTMFISRKGETEKPQVEFLSEDLLASLLPLVTRLSKLHKRKKAVFREDVERSFYVMDIEGLHRDLLQRWMEGLGKGLIRGAIPEKEKEE